MKTQSIDQYLQKKKEEYEIAEKVKSIFPDASVRKQSFETSIFKKEYVAPKLGETDVPSLFINYKIPFGSSFILVNIRNLNPIYYIYLGHSNSQYHISFADLTNYLPYLTDEVLNKIHLNMIKFIKKHDDLPIAPKNIPTKLKYLLAFK